MSNTPRQSPALPEQKVRAETQSTGADVSRADNEATPVAFDFLAPAQSADELGRLGGYRILKLLGKGGMGMVLLAEDLQLKRRVAIKVMRPDLAHENARRRFLREAQSAAAIEHDNIITIHHVGEERGVPYVVMPFLQGETLGDRLKREGKLPVKEAWRIAREIAEGLAAAHAVGMIHRDIKPSNIWLENRQGDKETRRTAAGYFSLSPCLLVSLSPFASAACENTGLRPRPAQ